MDHQTRRCKSGITDPAVAPLNAGTLRVPDYLTPAKPEQVRSGRPELLRAATVRINYTPAKHRAAVSAIIFAIASAELTAQCQRVSIAATPRSVEATQTYDTREHVCSFEMPVYEYNQSSTTFASTAFGVDSLFISPKLNTPIGFRLYVGQITGAGVSPPAEFLTIFRCPRVPTGWTYLPSQAAWSHGGGPQNQTFTGTATVSSSGVVTISETESSVQVYSRACLWGTANQVNSYRSATNISIDLNSAQAQSSRTFRLTHGGNAPEVTGNVHREYYGNHPVDVVSEPVSAPATRLEFFLDLGHTKVANALVSDDPPSAIFVRVHSLSNAPATVVVTRAGGLVAPSFGQLDSSQTFDTWQETSPGVYEGGLIIFSPSGFPADRDRPIQAQLTFTQQGIPTTASFMVYRKPVFLVHDGFVEKESMTTLGGELGARLGSAAVSIYTQGRSSRKYPFKPYRRDFFPFVSPDSIDLTQSVSQAAGPDYIEVELEGSLQRLRDQGIAVTRHEVVGHGSGALSLLAYAKRPGFRRPSNFGLGDFDRVIAVTAPLNGTPFATQALSFENSGLELPGFENAIINVAGKPRTIWSVIELKKRLIDGTISSTIGFRDFFEGVLGFGYECRIVVLSGQRRCLLESLAPGSTELTFVHPTAVPVDAVAAFHETSLFDVRSALDWLYAVFFLGAQGPASFSSGLLFGEPHDDVVGLSSQIFGTRSSVVVGGLSHFDAIHSSEVISAVECLLAYAGNCGTSQKVLGSPVPSGDAALSAHRVVVDGIEEIGQGVTVELTPASPREGQAVSLVVRVDGAPVSATWVRLDEELLRGAASVVLQGLRTGTFSLIYGFTTGDGRYGKGNLSLTVHPAGPGDIAKLILGSNFLSGVVGRELRPSVRKLVNGSFVATTDDVSFEVEGPMHVATRDGINYIMPIAVGRGRVRAVQGELASQWSQVEIYDVDRLFKSGFE